MANLSTAGRILDHPRSVGGWSISNRPSAHRGATQPESRPASGGGPPKRQLNQPARLIFSRSLSALTNVAFITGRVRGSRRTSRIERDEALDSEPRVLPGAIVRLHSVTPLIPAAERRGSRVPGHAQAPPRCDAPSLHPEGLSRGFSRGSRLRRQNPEVAARRQLS